MQKRFFEETEIITKERQVQEFLVTLLGANITDVHYVSGGKHSHAFSYSQSGGDYIIRLNDSKDGFLKDGYASKFFAGQSVPVPKILDIGVFEDGCYYGLSEKFRGETVRAQYNRKEYDSLFQQFAMIENISRIPVPDSFVGFGEWSSEQTALQESLASYVAAVYERLYGEENQRIFKERSYFDAGFVAYLLEKVQHYLQYSEGIREVVHGDFGNENVFLDNGGITGIIDWERSLIADHYIDVGRVVLFCPSREATVFAFKDFYHNTDDKFYQERLCFGVYYAMLKNYAAAALDNNEASCRSSLKRIQEFESLMGIN